MNKCNQERTYIKALILKIAIQNFDHRIHLPINTKHPSSHQQSTYAFPHNCIPILHHTECLWLKCEPWAAFLPHLVC